MLPNHRRCISCRKVSHKQTFWRIVRVFPSHAVQLDQGMGRSVYLCPTADCLQAAQKKNRLGRSLKANVPETIYHVLWQRLSSDGSLEDSHSSEDSHTNDPLSPTGNPAPSFTAEKTSLEKTSIVNFKETALE
jgi:hypothetical protein